MSGVLRACLRYFPVLLLGLLGTAGLAWWAATPTPVYFSQTDATFLAPISTKNPNSFTTPSDSLISLAGVIQREMDQADVGARTSSARVTLVDQGIFHGTRVKVPDNGGQWEHNYNRPVLDVQVTGSDRAEVTARALATQQTIERLVDERQAQAGVAPRNFIRVEMLPATPSVDLVSGRPTRAIGASILLGLSLSVVACTVTSQVHAWWRARRPAKPEPAAAPAEPEPVQVWA